MSFKFFTFFFFFWGGGVGVGDLAFVVQSMEGCGWIGLLAISSLQ